MKDNLTFKVETSVVGTDIHQKMTDYTGKVIEKVARTGEQQVRDALVLMGWTPPDTKPQVFTNLDEVYTDSVLVSYFKCPKCGDDKLERNHTYCPNCGVRVEYQDKG